MTTEGRRGGESIRTSIPQGRIIRGYGVIRDPVECNGSIIADDRISITGEINMTESTATVSLGSGSVIIEDQVSRLDAGDLASAAIYVDDDGINPGRFVQTGGTITVDYLRVGASAFVDSPGNKAEYVLSGGSLNVGSLEIGGWYTYPWSSSGNGPGAFYITSTSANIAVSKYVFLKSDSSFAAALGATIHMTGSGFYNYSTDPSGLEGLSNLTLIFEGGSEDVDPFEVAAEDMGAVIDGWLDNFALGSLTLGGTDIGQLTLRDNFDNQTDWAGDEALYVHNLNIGAGSYLHLNGYNLYYFNGLIDPGATIVYNGGSLTQIFLPGDTNGDGFEGGADLNAILSNWGITGATRLQGDLTGEGDVGGADYNQLLSHWGGSMPMPPEAPLEAIPEPAALGLMLVGGLALLRRRK